VQPQVQDAFATPGATPKLGVELAALNVIGYDFVATQPTVQIAAFARGLFSFSWNALPGQAYQVQFKTNLTGNVWSNLGALVTASNLTAGISDTNMSDSKRFYRVATVNPLAPPGLSSYGPQTISAPSPLITNSLVTHYSLP